MNRTVVGADWDAQLYRCFEAERTRPAADLLDRVPIEAPRNVVDLGCGPGNSTELLARRFPQASIVGIDTSGDMLAAARTRLPSCRFEQADIARWTPEASPDLLFANASLQWLDGHVTLLARLFKLLAPGGVLAVQMPDNREEPSHRSMRRALAEAASADLIGPDPGSRVKILTAPAYFDLLAPSAAMVDIWRTTYYHPMQSVAAIVTWLRATGLRPFLDALPADAQGEFLTRYEALLEDAYPPRADGRRLLAFPRLFVIAQARTDD